MTVPGTTPEPPERPFWESGLILRVRSGSRAYGLALPMSDEDSRGVCIPPKRLLLGIDTFEQHESEGGDHVVFGLAKFVRLALQGNPNIIETLHTSDEDVLYRDALGTRLLDARGLFLSRRVGERFEGYARGQMTRMKNHHAALQSGGGDERLRQRNPARAELERQHGFDTKHAMHLIRLLRMGEEILRTGEVHVRRRDAAELLAVRRGEWSFECVVGEAQALIERIAAAGPSSPLPVAPDEVAADELLVALHEAALADPERR